MPISMYDASVPMFAHSLKALRAVLEKAAAHAERKKFDTLILANSRLFPDMLPLINQIQIASDAAKGAAARLSGVEPPKFEDNEKTFPELLERIDKTIAFLASVTPDQFAGSEDRVVTIKTRQETHSFPGLIYLRHWAIPNFFFHITTAYNLLRHNGVEIGKSDFLGKDQR